MKHLISRSVVFAVVVVGSCFILAGCLPGSKTDSGSGAVLQTVTPSALTASKAYVGSSKCQQCHPGEFSQWQESWHARIVQPYTAGNIATGTPTAAQYAQTAGTGGADDSHLAITDAPWGNPGAWYTHGGRWKQRYIRKITNTIEGVDYSDFEIWGAQFNTMDGVWGKAGVNAYTSWKRRCNWCHNAGVDKNNLFSDKTEIGVGCEACHGPASGHLAATSNEERRAAIVKPSNLSKKAQATLCGSCHNRGRTSSDYNGVGASKYSSLGPNPTKCDFPISYELGMESIPDWNIGNDGYWNPTGELGKRVPTKHRMQYPDFQYSKHFGNVACNDCHRGHNFRIENLSDNNLCIRCHSNKSSTENLVAHAKHSYSTKNALLSSQLLCISCHMVRTAKTATSYDQAGHTFMKFTPAVSGDGGKTYSPSTCSQSKLGCHATEPASNLSEAAFNSPTTGSIIDKWKTATVSGKTVIYK